MLNEEVLENHKRYLERINFYQSFGYDVEKERDFIFDKSLPVFGEILEIGTGKGHFALTLAKHGYKFISIDISKQEQEIAMLNMKYFGLEKQAIFKIEDAARLSFPDKSFNTIFSINVFHHLEKPQAVLDEIIRLLRPEGKIVLSDFSARGLEIINACHAQEGNRHDYFKHRLDEARGFFADKGFVIKRFQSDAQEVIIAKYR